MKLFRLLGCPAYDMSGLCKKYNTPCKTKRACKLKQVLYYCMKNEEDIFNPSGYQNICIVNKLGVMK